MLGTLLEVVAAVAAEKSRQVSGAISAVLPSQVSDVAREIAGSLCSGRKVAIWLGNLAVQSTQALALQRVAQELAELTDGGFGVIGEAANSVGGYLAKAYPIVGGLDAKQMIDRPLKGYILMNAEPDLDFANPPATVAALKAAKFVVSLSAFVSPSLLESADVMLPVAPFSETSGTFVNCEGRAQSFSAVARPRGETRPAWKVIRVIGNLLELDGFEQNDSEAVAAEVLGEDIAARLDNRVDVTVALPQGVAVGLERVADVPIYAADPVVRRATSLQKTRDAAVPQARASAATVAALGLESGAMVRVRQGAGSSQLTIVADETIAANCIRVAAAHSTTAALGPMTGEISVERL
jgi:NADH-quinone oxidoreductase subunit G